MLLWLAGLSGIAGLVLMVHSEWTGHKVSGGMSYMALAGLLLLTAFHIWSGVTNGRTADDEALRQGILWAGISCVAALGLAIYAIYKLS